jgi:hypothetical protein
MTVAERSSQHVESKDSATESESDAVEEPPFLSTNPDFLKTEVVKAYAHTVVAPAIDYWKRAIQVNKGLRWSE